MPAANTMFGGGGPIAATAPMSSAPQTPSVEPAASNPPGTLSVLSKRFTIDGTPVRVSTLLLAAIGGYYGLTYLGGWKFHVTSG